MADDGLLGRNGAAPSNSLTTPDPTVWGADNDDLFRAIRDGVEARNEKDWEKYEAEIDQLLREALEPMYDKYKIRHSGKAPSTVRRYMEAFKKFSEYCNEGEVSSLPAKPGFVASYLHRRIVEDAASAETIRLIVAAISYAHKGKELFDPTEDELVKTIVHSTTINSRKKKVNGQSKEQQSALQSSEHV